MNDSNDVRKANEQEIRRLLQQLRDSHKDKREQAIKRIGEIQKQINLNKEKITRGEVLNSESKSNIPHLLTEPELPSGLFVSMINIE